MNLGSFFAILKLVLYNHKKTQNLPYSLLLYFFGIVVNIVGAK